ncbi:hypothetical protein BUALT_Bualt19G0046400 [Buddleja alternifolia]|uniref:Uncharacterized protein n=1 Tax=Buddleja alternifolia TaxID=168488 RepID=A0AAV6W9E7_9LAMI|nr:hypothetical protein BUALT_Bualt19G0046400 [Buddleja alternifolia]
MMVCNLLSSSSSTLPRLIPTTYKPPPPPLPPRILQVGRRKRGISLVTRAGPSASSYIFAFVLPLSLLAVTIFTSVRIADKLEQKFLEELAVNQAILEAEENDEEVSIPSVKEPAPTRTRNRPKREVEPSSK